MILYQKEELMTDRALDEAKQLTITRIPHKIEVQLQESGNRWTLTVKPKEPKRGD